MLTGVSWFSVRGMARYQRMPAPGRCPRLQGQRQVKVLWRLLAGGL